jgi:uncharacterized membrane protein YecN with MAPEG domain
MFVVTSYYAAVLAMLFLVLSARVIVARRESRTQFGSGSNAALERRMRVHANFAEYAPFGLLLLALAELRGISVLWLHAMGGLLAIGRVVHAIGVSRPQTDELGRVIGMSGTLIAIAGTSALIVVSGR